MPAGLDLHDHIGPVVITLLYVGLYYGFQVNVLRVKTVLTRAATARGERFDRYFGDDRTMLAADRMQLNMLEHMGPFLVLFWLNAVFVDGPWTTVAGGVYVAARAIYPFMLGGRLGRGIPGKVLVATVPGYAVLTYLCGALVAAMFTS